MIEIVFIVATLLTVLSPLAEARWWRPFRHHHHRHVELADDGSGVVVVAKSQPDEKLSWCEAQRIVEMRNAVLDANLLCKDVVTEKDYNAFIIANRARIKFANDVAVAYHMKKYGNRKKFDELDSRVMNRNSATAAKNPPYFCNRMKSIKEQIKTKNIDELLATQNELEVPTCD